MIKMSTVRTVLNSAMALDQMRPKTGDPGLAALEMRNWHSGEMGCFLRALDQLCLNARQLEHELDQTGVPMLHDSK